MLPVVSVKEAAPVLSVVASWLAVTGFVGAPSVQLAVTVPVTPDGGGVTPSTVSAMSTLSVAAARVSGESWAVELAVNVMVGSVVGAFHAVKLERFGDQVYVPAASGR